MYHRTLPTRTPAHCAAKRLGGMVVRRGASAASSLFFACMWRISVGVGYTGVSLIEGPALCLTSRFVASRSAAVRYARAEIWGGGCSRVRLFVSETRGGLAR